MRTDRVWLYQMIWSDGIHRTAKELGIGKKQLMDICAAYDIPLPTKSYWSILSLGKIVPEKTPLPPFKGNQEVIIVSDVATGDSSENDSLSGTPVDKEQKKRDIKSKSKEIVPVVLKAGTVPVNEGELERENEKLRKKALQKVKSHSLRLVMSENMAEWTPKIETAVRAYPISKVLRPKKAIILDSLEYYTNHFKPWGERDSGRYYHNSKNTHLSLSVSKEMLRPALAVYDSIIDIAEALGLSLEYEGETTWMHIGDFKIEISVREINRQVMTTDPGTTYTRRELKGTGKLKLCIGCGYGLKDYAETDYIDLQTRLVSFFKGLMTSYLEKLEWRERRRLRELQEQEAAEKRRLEELERQRIAKLKDEELKRIESLVCRAYRLKVFQSLQSLALEHTMRGNHDESAGISEVARMFDPISPQYGDLLGEDDIDNLVRKLMNGD